MRALPPEAARNQPLKVEPAKVGAAGNVIVVPWGPLIELTALPPSELKVIVIVPFTTQLFWRCRPTA